MNTSHKSSGLIKKYFDLENDEYLLGTHSKTRPVILLKKFESNWNNPSNKATNLPSWMVLPIFSYKERHNQEFVLQDQRFKTTDRIYLPPAYSLNPGITEESAILLQTMQSINETHLKPFKLLEDASRIQKPFKICKIGLQIILFHYIKNLGILNYFSNPKEAEDETIYDMFVENVNAIIDASLT